MNFADFIWEMGRSDRDEAPSTVVRFATVTAVGTDDDGTPGLQTSLSADAWLRYLDGVTVPVVNDTVAVVQQGTDMWVLGRLAA